MTGSSINYRCLVLISHKKPTWACHVTSWIKGTRRRNLHVDRHKTRKKTRENADKSTIPQTGTDHNKTVRRTRKQAPKRKNTWTTCPSQVKHYLTVYMNRETLLREVRTAAEIKLSVLYSLPLYLEIHYIPLVTPFLHLFVQRVFNFFRRGFVAWRLDVKMNKWVFWGLKVWINFIFICVALNNYRYYYYLIYHYLSMINLLYLSSSYCRYYLISFYNYIDSPKWL